MRTIKKNPKAPLGFFFNGGAQNLSDSVPDTTGYKRDMRQNDYATSHDLESLEQRDNCGTYRHYKPPHGTCNIHSSSHQVDYVDISRQLRAKRK